MRISPLAEWPNGSSLSATMSAGFQFGVFRPGEHELLHHTPLRKLVKPASKGTINFSINFEAQQPNHSVFRTWKPPTPIVLTMDFECDESGNLRMRQKEEIATPWANDFYLGVTFRTWTDNRLGGPGHGYAPAPPEIRVLHTLMDVSIDLLWKGKGERNFRHSEHGTSTFGIHEASVPGSSDKTSAFLGRMMVELVQPVSKLQGVKYHVQFPVDGSTIMTPHDIEFDHFLKASIKDVPEVRTALARGLLTFRGEARASATYKGPPVPGRKRHNQELSEQRKKTVVDYIKKAGVQFTEPTLIQAIGDTKAVMVGEENPLERRCEVSVQGDELTWAVQQDWLTKGMVK